MRQTSALFVVAIGLGTSAFAQKKPVTLEALDAAPSRQAGGSPTWAPDGKRFAYSEGGKLMLYDVAAKAERELASLTEITKSAEKVPADDAFDWQNRRVRGIGLQWLPNGQDVLLSAGGDLFLHHLATKQTEQLTKTPVAEADPKLSPDGKRVAFRREHDLYVLNLEDKKETALTQDGTANRWNGQLDWVYPEELDLGTAFWWSPDGRQIAYMQFDIGKEMMYPHADLLKTRALAEPERYPQAGTANAEVRLGVVSVTEPKTTWMQLGDLHDKLLARVQWTPDARHVSAQVLNRVQNQLDFLLAEAETGTTRQLFRETDPTWINVSDDLQFLPNGSFFWTSERDGFRHIYLYSAEGKQTQQLTKGDWAVTGIDGVDEKARQVFFTASKESPLRRDLYRVNFDGSGLQRLTREAGTHAIAMSPTCEYYLDTFSSLQEPPRRTLYDRGGKVVVNYREPDRKAQQQYDLLPTEIVEFKDDRGTAFYARLIKPANFQAGKKYPAVVTVYGGPHAQSIVDRWTGVTWDQVMAHKGFVVWQMDNRGAGGRGHLFESPLYRRLGKTELEDQTQGIKKLVSLGFVDPARIGLYGWSYGGYMTLYSLTHAPTLFKAGIAGAPVTNWQNYDTIYTERYLGLPSENEQGYKDSSPVNSAANLQAKLMIIHNFEDDNVLFQNTMQMMDALQRAGKQFEFTLYPQKAHGVTGPVRGHLMKVMTDFFERNL